MEGIIYHKTDGHAVEHDDIYIKHGSNEQVKKTSTCVLNEKMGQPAGSAWLTSKKSTLLRFLSMQLPITYLMPLIFCGGLHMYSRSAA
jgi:hypothetical protein